MLGLKKTKLLDLVWSRFYLSPIYILCILLTIQCIICVKRRLNFGTHFYVSNTPLDALVRISQNYPQYKYSLYCHISKWLNMDFK